MNRPAIACCFFSLGILVEGAAVFGMRAVRAPAPVAAKALEVLHRRGLMPGDRKAMEDAIDLWKAPSDRGGRPLPAHATDAQRRHYEAARDMAALMNAGF